MTKQISKPTSEFRIRVESRIKHGILAELAEKFGGNCKLAEELGVCPETVSAWIRLKSFPRVTARRKMTKKRRRVYCKLCELTGKTIEQIFPGFIREPLRSFPKTVVIDRTIHSEGTGLRMRDSQQARFITSDPQIEAMKSEAREELKKQLDTLSYREKQILKLRYGLGDGYSYSLQETADVFKVGRERIRQIEAKAIRKLQQPWRYEPLRDVIVEA